MTQPLAIPQRQVTAICRGAAKAGFEPATIGLEGLGPMPDFQGFAGCRFTLSDPVFITESVPAVNRKGG